MLAIVMEALPDLTGSDRSRERERREERHRDTERG
jgi:hypothetical protein